MNFLQEIESTFVPFEWKLVKPLRHAPVEKATCFVCKKPFQKDEEIFQIKKDRIRIDICEGCTNIFDH